MNLERFISSGDGDKFSAGHWLCRSCKVLTSLHSDLQSNGITVFQNTLSNNTAQILFQRKIRERMKQYNVIVAISKLGRKMESDKSRLSEE